METPPKFSSTKRPYAPRNSHVDVLSTQNHSNKLVSESRERLTHVVQIEANCVVDGEVAVHAGSQRERRYSFDVDNAPLLRGEVHLGVPVLDWTQLRPWVPARKNKLDRYASC